MSNISAETSLNYDNLKSSRRRRWDMKSNELSKLSSNTSLNLKNTSKNKGDKSLPEIHKSFVKSKESDSAEEDADILSAKLSAILNNASYYSEVTKSKDSKLQKSSGSSSAPDKRINAKKSKAKSFNGVTMNSKILDQLKYLKDDIVEFPSNVNERNLSLTGILQPKSSVVQGNVNTLYCEHLNNFVLSHKINSINNFDSERFYTKGSVSSIKIQAVNLQRGFQAFALFCHGLLSGLSLSHTLLVFSLFDGSDLFSEEWITWKTLYSLITFLSVVCIVSAMDRYNINLSRICDEHCFKIPWSLMYYGISIILHFSLVGIEDFIINHNSYPNFIQAQKEEWIVWWKYISLVRTCFFVLAWASTVIDPVSDALGSRIINDFK